MGSVLGLLIAVGTGITGYILQAINGWLWWAGVAVLIAFAIFQSPRFWWLGVLFVVGTFVVAAIVDATTDDPMMKGPSNAELRSDPRGSLPIGSEKCSVSKLAKARWFWYAVFGTAFGARRGDHTLVIEPRGRVCQ
jgi:hypothetical protein